MECELGYRGTVDQEELKGGDLFPRFSTCTCIDEFKLSKGLLFNIDHDDLMKFKQVFIS